MTTLVQCITCDRFTLKTGSDEWARQGFGNCANREKFIMFGAVKDRDCGEHWPAPEAVVEKRRAWLKVKTANALGDRLRANTDKQGDAE